jgi:hypothetical protein
MGGKASGEHAPYVVQITPGMLVFAALPTARIYPAPTMTTSRLSFVLLALLIAMVSAWLWPALGMQFFFAYGDNAIHGLPLAQLHARIMEGSETALWTPLIYGGHPLFAETQGAFANPVNIVLSTLLPPLQVSILLHWIGMAMSITGMFALCRMLSLSPLASAFAALAAVMSPFWLSINNNMTVMAAVGWVPWTLWSFELWLKRQSLPTAILFGAMTAMLLLPGYPHLLHASVLYMAVSLLPTVLHRVRNGGVARLRTLLIGGAIAAIVTVGLTAVQTLPLVELIGQSHRSQGVALPWFVFPILFERGLFFWTEDTGGPMHLFPIIGSTLACVLAAAAVWWAPRHRIIGIALATFLLGHLGAGRASDIFNFAYTYHLIPGLHSFRITHPFFLPAVIGIAVLSAAGIDGVLQRQQQRLQSSQTRTTWLLQFLPGLLMAALVLAYAVKIHVPGISRLFLATAAIALLAVVATSFTRRHYWFAPLLLVLMTAEIMHVKFVRPHYQPVALLQEPEIVQQIPPEQRRDYKFLDLADTAAFGIANTSPYIEAWYRRMLAAVGPSTNLLWDVPSIGGAFALNLRRQSMLEPHLRSEAAGQILQTPWLRLIDTLGIRYIVALTELPTAGFTLMRHDVEKGLYFYRNEFALPRFQNYDHALTATDPEDAFKQLKTLQTRVLVIEADAAALKAIGAEVSLDANAELLPDGQFSITIQRAKSDDYRFDTNGGRGSWLFIVDNMYPGWIATLDGEPTPVFAAQIMGKAVWVPAGKHTVEIRFVSRSFQLGLAISVTTIAALLILFVVRWRRRTTAYGRQITA